MGLDQPSEMTESKAGLDELSDEEAYDNNYINNVVSRESGELMKN